MKYGEAITKLHKTKPNNCRVYGNVYKTEERRIVYTDGLGILIIKNVSIPAEQQNRVFDFNGIPSQVKYPSYQGIVDTPFNPFQAISWDFDYLLLNEAISTIKPNTRLCFDMRMIAIGKGIPLHTLISLYNMIKDKRTKVTEVHTTKDGLYKISLSNDCEIYVPLLAELETK